MNRSRVLIIYAVRCSPYRLWRLGIFDAGVMGWRVTDLAEHEAHEQAADLNVTFNQYGQRDQADRIEVNPPIEVQSATWSAAGQLDWWVKERREWWGRVRGPEVDRRGSKLQIFGLPSKASSRDLSLSVIIGSLLAHCQK
jgi:hypothetical protein